MLIDSLMAAEAIGLSVARTCDGSAVVGRVLAIQT